MTQPSCRSSRRVSHFYHTRPFRRLCAASPVPISPARMDVGGSCTPPTPLLIPFPGAGTCTHHAVGTLLASWHCLWSKKQCGTGRAQDGQADRPGIPHCLLQLQLVPRFGCKSIRLLEAPRSPGAAVSPPGPPAHLSPAGSAPQSGTPRTAGTVVCGTGPGRCPPCPARLPSSQRLAAEPPCGDTSLTFVPTSVPVSIPASFPSGLTPGTSSSGLAQSPPRCRC